MEIAALREIIKALLALQTDNELRGVISDLIRAAATRLVARLTAAAA